MHVYFPQGNTAKDIKSSRRAGKMTPKDSWAYSILLSLSFPRTIFCSIDNGNIIPYLPQVLHFDIGSYLPMCRYPRSFLPETIYFLFLIYLDTLHSYYSKENCCINEPTLLKMHRLSLRADICSKWITAWHVVSKRRKTSCEEAACQMNILTQLQYTKWSLCCPRDFYIQDHERLTFPTLRVAPYYFTG